MLEPVWPHFTDPKIDEARTAEGVPTYIQTQIPCGAREVRDFHNPETASVLAHYIDSYQCCGRNSAFGAGLREMGFGIAPNPVTALWTACTRLKTHVLTNAYFSLTEKIEGVQQDRSLTAS
jgi:hypothetical protein